MMSKTFEFAERFGFESKFNNIIESNEHLYYWTGDINFQKIIDHIKNKEPIRIKNHDIFFKKGQKIKIGGYGFNKGKFKEYLTGVNNKVPISPYFAEKSRASLKIVKEGNEEEFFYNGYIINTYNHLPSTISKSKVEFGASINIKEQSYRYRLMFPFNGEKGGSVFEKYGIIIEAGNYSDYEILLEYLSIDTTINFRNKVIEKFNAAFKEAKGDCNIIDDLYVHAPGFVIEKKLNFDLWDDLVSLSKCGIDRETVFSGTDENIAVLNILVNFPSTSYLYNQFWKYPKVLEDLLYRIDPDYRLDLLKLLSSIFIDNWKNKDIENSVTYNIEPYETFYPFKPEQLNTRIQSWCIIDEDKKSKNYEIGYTAYWFDQYSLVSSIQKQVPLGWFEGINPVKVSFRGNIIYMPVFAAKYFTEEYAREQRKIFINDYVLTGYVSAPSSVAKATTVTATVTAKTAQLARAKLIKSKIAKRFKGAVGALKQRIKNIKEGSKQSKKLTIEAIELIRKQKVIELYKKGYNYVKVGMPSRQVIVKLFPKSGTRLVNSVEKEFVRLTKTFSKGVQKNVVLVNGIIYKNKIDILVFHTNYNKLKLNKFLTVNKISRGKANLADVKKIYKHLLKEGHIKYDMHKFIEKRLIKHFEELKKGIKHSTHYDWDWTGGVPGIHAEILSINEMLHRIEKLFNAKGVEMTEEVFSEMIGFNKRLIDDTTMIRCGDCNFLSYDVHFVEQILK